MRGDAPEGNRPDTEPGAESRMEEVMAEDTESNRRPPPCKRGALPAELIPREQREGGPK